MQIPTRRAEKNHQKAKLDPYLTEDKFRELKAKLERMLKARPELAREVKRLAEMGDFSENAGYQLAKGRLRGLNQRILDLEYRLKNVEIIRPEKNTEIIRLGSRVALRQNGQEKNYQILGATESDPSAGIISHNSPLGAALLGRRAGEKIKLRINNQDREYEIIKIG
jgi:transcription elongation factor GreA